MGQFPYGFNMPLNRNERMENMLAANFRKAETEAGAQAKVDAYATTASGLYIPKSIGDAKGDLIGFSADNTPVRIPAVAGDGYVATSDNSVSSGVAWKPGIPVGGVQAFAGSSAPTGWLLCYGQAVSRTTYAALYAVIGTTYGTGNGSTTFNLPDLRGRTVAGLDNMGGTDAGRLDMANTLGTAGGNQNGTAYSVLPSGYSGGAAYRHSYDGYSAIASAMGGSISLIGVMGTTDGTGWSKTGGSFTEVYAVAYAISRMQPTMLLNWIIYAAA